MSIWLCEWSIDLLHRRDRGSPDTCPILLVAEEHQREVVARCCRRAAFDAGALRIEDHDPARDLRALRSLAAWAHALSPCVAIDDACEEPDGLLLDVTGCARVFRGEQRLAEVAVARLAKLGVHARAAIAPTFGCAWAIARFGAERVSVMSTGDVRTTLAPLPVAALRIDADTITALAEIGIERIEHLLDLPRSALPARFGGTLLLNLDRALGQAIETIRPIRPVPPPVCERIFEGPTDRTEAVELTVRDLLAQLSKALLDRESGARSITVELVRADLPPEHLSLTLGRPSRDVKHLWRLLQPRLERANLGFGIEGVRIRAGAVARLRHEQNEHSGGWGGDEGRGVSPGEAEKASFELIDTLANRLGPERVCAPIAIESHVPERAFALRSVVDAPTKRSAPAQIALSDRPTVLFARPVPVEVVALTPDGPVHRVRWEARDEGVVTSAGPERIGREWWEAKARREATRDYFAIQTESGRWLWIRRDLETGRWFAHGEWA